MKRVLIISPYFPPSNAADMQRVRMSLPYFEQFGWLAEVVTVDSWHAEMIKDELLLKTVPKNIPVHQVDALPKKWTAKVGLGSLALRSLYYYRQTVNRLLKLKHYDLIYFSTTQFPVCILGAYWKKKYGIPYVIDMQDPWHSDYYRDKPKNERPPKYWFSYRLNKYLEPIAMKQVSGLISVSPAYIETLKLRYPVIADVPARTITFGAFNRDMEVASQHRHQLKLLLRKNLNQINVVYVGRGGHDMRHSVVSIFTSLAEGLRNEAAIFSKLHFYFIGTSYAAKGQGNPTIAPLAQSFGVESQVTEITDRIGFYESIATLQAADALIIPGSDHSSYTASKIYPYLLTQKPLLSIFHEESNAVNIIKRCSPKAEVLTFSNEKKIDQDKIYATLRKWALGALEPCLVDTASFGVYEAENMTKMQTELFNQVV
jgi:hypothetical protein